MGESNLKKTILPLLLGVLLMSGCSLLEKKEPVSVALHHVASAEVIETKNGMETHEISIVDPRDSTIIEVLKMDDFQSEEELKAKATQLASDLAATIDRQMKPAKLNAVGELQEGQSRMILHEEELIDRLLDDSIFNKQVVLPIEETKPNVTQEEVQGINEVVLGSFTTYFNASVEGRSFNIKTEGTVGKDGKRLVFEKIVHKLVISVKQADNELQEKLIQLAHRAEKACFISQTLKGNVEVSVEPVVKVVR